MPEETGTEESTGDGTEWSEDNQDAQQPAEGEGGTEDQPAADGGGGEAPAE